MERQITRLLLTCLVCSSVLVAMDPRGPRLVEPGYKADKCATQKEWAFCSDEDWGPKCPSGCRVLGLMDKHDHEMLKKISRIRTLLEKNQGDHSSTDRITKQTYDYIKDKLTITTGSDNSYYEMSQKLRQRIVDMKLKIDRQLQLMHTMKEQIKVQVADMQRLEVDIDMKLRHCKGSCKTYAEFSVDQASYVALDKQMAQLDVEVSQSVAPSRALYVMTSRAQQAVVVDNRFKSKLDNLEMTLFNEVQARKLILEEAGSVESPATVSKDADCADILQHHTRGQLSGVFEVLLGQGQDTRVVQVYCDQSGFMGGWLLVQQRETGLQNFNRSWAEYRQGFGSVDAQGRGEVWLGNHNLHLLTNQSGSMLKVELEDWEGGVATAQYSIRVGTEEEGFRLEVSHYEGEAGDALGGTGPLMSHSGMRFSTFDRDRDSWGEGSCAELYGGGWWYNNCLAANLNGVYYRGKYDAENNSPYEVENGVVWTPYKPADYSLKRVRMSIRPATF